MNNYQPYEGSQGDPWSTEPVQEPSRGRGDASAESFYDRSPEVLARMPDLEGEGRGDSEPDSRRRSHGQGAKRRSPRPSGIPTSVWAFGGLVLLAVALIPFFLKGNSTSETALEEPNVWQPEMPAPDAPPAPSWSATADSQWEQAGTWPQGPAVPATVSAEPGVPGSWNATPPTADWIGAPAAAPYAGNAAGGFNRDGQPNPHSEAAQAAPVMNPPFSDNTSSPNWGSGRTQGEAPAPNNRDYPGAAARAAEPIAPREAAASTARYDGTSAYGTSGPATQVPAWSQPGADGALGVPQADTVSPGYGAYPVPATRASQGQPLSATTTTPPMHYESTRANSYTSQPAASYPSTASPGQYPAAAKPLAGEQPATGAFARQAPVGSFSAAAEATVARREAYAVGTLSPGPAAPAQAAASGATTDWGAPAAYPGQPLQQGVQAGGAYPAATAPADFRSAAAANPAAAYPSTTYPSTTTYPSAQLASPVTGQPNYSGAAAPQASAARLSGVIQEPNSRAAYDDRARPSFY
ncbi:MAG: hypothetical protein GXY25_10005 [Pirellulaceae bacterium]|jgi:hypothetical protein|nr:hypothetical protein [Thermoguttaceae bacterium]NLZ00858.1 hypothetical protein [Pirellulaceae bacterium]